MTEPTPEPAPAPGPWAAGPPPPWPDAAADVGGLADPAAWAAQSAVAAAHAKSRLTAGLLGLFLGGMGAHRFYLGYTSMGVLQILVTIATLGIGAMWGLVEGIVILNGSGLQSDADGRPLRP